MDQEVHIMPYLPMGRIRTLHLPQQSFDASNHVVKYLYKNTIYVTKYKNWGPASLVGSNIPGTKLLDLKTEVFLYFVE